MNSNPTTPNILFNIMSLSFGDQGQASFHQSSNIPLSNLPPELRIPFNSIGIFSDILNSNFQQTNTGNFQDILDQLFQQHQPRATPTSSKALQKLPEIIIEEKHLAQKLECTICKDSFSLGDQTIQLPCEHLYHSECIQPWLAQNNTCPVCRYELPVDDAELESRRKERMAQRNVLEDFLWERTPDEILESTPVPLISQEDLLKQNEMKSEDESSSTSSQSGRCDLKENSSECLLLKEPVFCSLTCGHNLHMECLETALQSSGQLENQNIHSLQKFICPVCKTNTSIVKDFDVD